MKNTITPIIDGVNMVNSKIGRLPNLSDNVPNTTPPNMTPMKYIVVARLVLYASPQTRSH